MLNPDKLTATPFPEEEFEPTSVVSTGVYYLHGVMMTFNTVLYTLACKREYTRCTIRSVSTTFLSVAGHVSTGSFVSSFLKSPIYKCSLSIRFQRTWID